MCVESKVESFIPIYNLQKSKYRAVEEATAEAEMMIHMNVADIGKIDKVWSAALDLYLKGNPWHFILMGNILKHKGK